MSFTDPQNWQKIKEVFYEALDLTENERAQFLNSACDDDLGLRREVEEMLASSEASGGFMKTPPFGEIAALFADNGERLTLGQEFGQYKILNVLGSGGMGKVYLANDTRLGRRVALKILSPEIYLDQGGLKRFIREAKTASSLNHPNILTIYESGEEGTINYIASEYVEGETLTDRLRNGPMSVKLGLDIAVQICGALQAAHGAGIIHRDIKPDNIMIRPDGVVKLLDFGIAKLVRPEMLSGESTTRGTIIGTPNYLSPEQARGKEIGVGSDIFSFGLVFYEMLSGTKAFAAEDPIDVIGSILQKEPTPLGEVAPDVPPEIVRIISQCLQKAPSDRYTTAADLLADLGNVRQDLAFQNRSNDDSQGKAAVRTAGENTVATAKGLQATTAKGGFATSFARERRAVVIAAAVILIFGGSLVWYFYPANPTASGQISSIAVLPFVNESNDPNADYLADGIAETLISSLSRLPALNVRSRASTFAYRGRDTRLRQIANELDVQAILNGRVAERGDELTLYVELVDAASDKVIWSQNYKQPISNLLSLQTEIARDVSSNLRLKLSPIDEQNLTKRSTTSVEAFQLYLKGNFEWNKHTRESLQAAIGYYDQALKIDPNNALAYTGLSKTYGVIGNNYLPANVELPKAREYVEKALQIDESLAEAHSVMAAAHLYYEWDRDAAELEVERALAIDPKNSLAHQIAASRFESLGRFDEAIVERQKALEIDPLSPVENWLLGTTYYLKRDNDSAITQLKQTITIEPRFSPAYLFLGQAYEQKKMYSEAVETYQTGITQAEPNPKLLASLVHAYYLFGKHEQAAAALGRLEEESRQHYVTAYIFAVAYAGMGKKEQMFAALEKAAIERPADMLWLRVEPMFDPYRNDPRFESLLKQMRI